MDKVQCSGCGNFFDCLVDDGLCENCFSKKLDNDKED